MLTRRNILSLISVLPTEILARLFHFSAFSKRFAHPNARLGLLHACMPALVSGRAGRLDGLDALLKLPLEQGVGLRAAVPREERAARHRAR